MAFDPFALFRESGEECRRREERERLFRLKLMAGLACLAAFAIGIAVGYLSR